MLENELEDSREDATFCFYGIALGVNISNYIKVCQSIKGWFLQIPHTYYFFNDSDTEL